MSVTVVVEPDPGGHRFQYVRHVAELAGRDGEVLLLTIRGARAGAEFATYLGDVELEVEECFDGIRPPTRELAEAVAALARAQPIGTVLIMDADQALKRWWLEAPRAFRDLAVRPRVVFLLTRYPARLPLRDGLGWRHRLAKGSLALLATARGVLDRTLTLAGRDDLATGWFVERVRDPAICSAHSRDRAELRTVAGLPGDRKLVGIFGVIDARKNVPLVAAACRQLDGVDLVLGGSLSRELAAWLRALPPEHRAGIHLREGFLDNAEIDRLVASCDAVAIAQNNNGPSGIMGKALAAGVPVVSAGSVVRARELAATGGGVSVDLAESALADGIRTVLNGLSSTNQLGAVALVGPGHFAAALLHGPSGRR